MSPKKVSRSATKLATGRLAARKRSNTSPVARAWCVTSSGDMVRGRPQSNTIAAASGSAHMLNSAAGILLPTPIAPPINEIALILGKIPGSRRIAVAIFVSGPVGTIVMSPSEFMSRSMSRSTPCCATGSISGSGTSGPSIPDSPWILAAWLAGRTSGRSMPLATGTSRIFASEHTFKALRVVLSSDWLPATVVIASRSMSGWWAASRMAMASSWPGSQSRIILCFIYLPLHDREGRPYKKQLP